MSQRQEGFTLVEMIIATSITVLVAAAAVMALSQIYGGTGNNNSHITAVQQVQNAGFWISRDAQRASLINTTNLSSTDLVSMNWTEWDAAGNPTFFSVTYTFINLSANVGQLRRTYWSSNTGSEQSVVGRSLYFNPGDSAYSSKSSYQSPVATIQLTAIVEKAREIREYVVKRRPNT